MKVVAVSHRIRGGWDEAAPRGGHTLFDSKRSKPADRVMIRLGGGAASGPCRLVQQGCFFCADQLRGKGGNRNQGSEASGCLIQGGG